MIARVLCTVALLAACKSDGASPPSPSSGPAPASAPAPSAPAVVDTTGQPGTSVRSARVAVDVPAPAGSAAGSASSTVEPAAQRRAGQLSPEERRKRAASLHTELDADKDGKLTIDELRRSPLSRLDPLAMDTNQDGAVSLDELDAALAAVVRSPSR